MSVLEAGASSALPWRGLFYGRPGWQKVRAMIEAIVGEEVLVLMAAELAFHLGVTARQPLNNMPYFRISRLGDNTAMSKRGGSRTATSSNW
jgi:hypothetical protein